MSAQSVDLVFSGRGIYELSSPTKRGAAWLKKHVIRRDTITTSNGSIAIDGGAYAQQIAEGAEADGLRVERP